MDIQVSLKVRAAIKAKLVELGLHVDEELPDYVMVLVANRRTKAQMDQDLQLFLGDNTVKFTGWLQHVLSKLDELTSAGSSGTSTAATVSKKEKKSVDKSKSGSPKKKKPAQEKEGRKKEVPKEEKSKSATSSSKPKPSEKEKSRSSKSEADTVKHREPPASKSKADESGTKSSKSSNVHDKYSKPSRESGEKRKVGEHAPLSPVKAKKLKETRDNDNSTLKFQLKKGESKNLPQKSALSAHEESPPKRSLPLLGDKSPEHDLVNTKQSSDVSESAIAEQEFKMPTLPSKKKAESIGPAPEDDEFLSLNAADDDDFLKDDKEKDELELLRKNALESKNKSRNYMRTLQINDRIIQKQKQIEEKEKQKLDQDAEERLQHEKSPEQKSSPHKESNKHFQERESNEVSSSENKEVVSSSSPSKRSESRNSAGSQIRSILLSNREAMRDIRGDAREILERRKLQRGQVVNHHRDGRDRSPSPESKKLKSAVGALIKREKIAEDEEYDPVKPEVKVASVVHVAARPKREKDATRNLVMRAFADAQKSIVISNSQQFDRRRKSRSRSRSRERPVRRRKSYDEEDEYERKTRGRYANELERRPRPRERSPGRGSIADRIGRRLRDEEIYGEDENVQVKKRSITERLGNGYKPPVTVKKSIHERLGVKRTGHFDKAFEPKGQDPTPDNPASSLEAKQPRYKDIEDDDMIIVSVPSSTAGRNVSLESMKERPRISIPLRDDDDTTDDEQYDPVATSLELRRKRLTQNSSGQSDGGKSSDNDYIVEEYEQEETDDEIEVVIRDTSLKLPEPLEEEDLPVQSNDISVTSEHEQKQQEQLQSEAELGQIMAKGPEIRTPLQLNAPMSVAEVGSTPALKPPKIFQGAWQATVYRPSHGLPLSNTLKLNTKIPGQCQYWPDCQFRDNCKNIHPRCKFGDSCKNVNCMYKHSGIKVVPGGLQTSAFSGRTPAGPEQCKYFPACHTLNCPFYHPTPCKFGLGCNDIKCKNFHPGETRAQKQKSAMNGRKYLPAAHQLKWSKTSSTSTA